MFKNAIVIEWASCYVLDVSDKVNAPRTVKDVKIISAGKILENNKTVGECRNALCDVPGGITTMHVVVSQPPQEKGTIKFVKSRNILFMERFQVKLSIFAL